MDGRRADNIPVGLLLRIRFAKYTYTLRGYTNNSNHDLENA